MTKPRYTHRVALRDARALVKCAMREGEKTGNYSDAKEWLEHALEISANPKSIDMRQLNRIADAFFKVGQGRLGDRGNACHSIDEFLKFCKDISK